MNEKVNDLIKVFILAIIAVIILKILGFAINVIGSIVLPVAVIYLIVKVLKSKGSFFD
ncbi:MAG: hypothetical protein Q4D88_06665 [Anaerococcus sp.]|nr:hypothetical protein [Anaerococcus sp.]